MKKKREIKALKAQVKDLEAVLREAWFWRNAWYDYAEELENYIEIEDGSIPRRPRGWHD